MHENNFFGFSWFLVLFLLVLPSGNIFGQTYRFMHIDSRQGLSHNFVKNIYRDKTGFIWVGTESGLNRFDGYSVKVYRNDPEDSSSLFGDNVARLFEVPGGELGVVTDNGVCFYDPTTERFSAKSHFLEKLSTVNPADVTDIVQDRAGNYWVVLANSGLLCFNETRKNTISLRHIDSDGSTISSNHITSFTVHHDGSYWIAHSNGVVENAVFDKGSLSVVKRISFFSTSLRKNDKPLHNELMVDKDGDLWGFIANVDEGVFYYNTGEDKVYHFRKNATPAALSSDLISGIVQDDEGYIWISSGSTGIDILDKKDFSIRNVVHDSDIGTSLRANAITTLYKDPEGIIWIGTFKKGLNFFHKSMERFPVYNRNSKPFGLPFEDINHFAEDKKGNLWLGTDGGGLIYFDRKSGRFTTYRHNPKDPHSLSSDVIVSLFIDHEDKLWIGTLFGGLNCFDGSKFTRYQHRVDDPNSFSDKSAWEIFEDSKHQLWIGTLEGGVNLFNRKTKTFTRYSHPQQKALISPYTSTIMEHRQGNLWFGTSLGVDVLQKGSGNIVHFETDKNNPASLVSNVILGILEDSRGRMWIGTTGGLSVWQRETNRFTSFTEKDGLPNNTIMSMEEDCEGRLWLGTSNGLVCATPVTSGDSIQLRFTNYSEADGLQGQRFNEGASLRLKSGELVFGGDNGFNIFNPKDIARSKTIPRLVFTDFQLFNKSIRPESKDTEGRLLLSSSITTNPSVVLAASDNVFSVEFAALTFLHSSETRYKYKLEGFNNDWQLADANSRSVTYTNLDAGDYIFRVIATNDEGEWSGEGISLSIKVLPSFWETGVAFVIYILLVFIGCCIVGKIIRRNERMKLAIKHQQEEAKRLRELDKLKTNFFTDVSHEFRTPLSLILSPLEKLREQLSGVDQRKNIDLIHRNTRRLLNLVNTFLDFRKMEVHDIRFHPSEGDIVRVVRDTVYSFRDLSEKKNVKLTFESNTSSQEAIFDHDKIEKILYHLLSNAFKFTLGNGPISVVVNVSDLSENRIVEIRVKDSGIGIPPEKHEQIFDRFFQNESPRSIMNQGNGIGLAITKEFVRIHGGHIRVESEVGKGSSFIVTLPLQKISNAIHETVINPVHCEVNTIADEGAISKQADKPLILLVENSENFRLYLKDNLKIQYEVLEASTGEGGWRKAVLKCPDLIIANAVIPDMKGADLCKRIKSDQRTNYIPVILISACSSEGQWLEGFEAGAAAYIAKPFSIPILMSRIRNLISLRKRIEGFIERENSLSEGAMSSSDAMFIREVVGIIEKNIANNGLTVMDVSRELGISRTLLFRKVQTLTGKSPLELIRWIRMQHAAQLLEKSQLPISEITCRVGFTNAKYFARLFKKQYYVLPSEYANGKRRIIGDKHLDNYA